MTLEDKDKKGNTAPETNNTSQAKEKNLPKTQRELEAVIQARLAKENQKRDKQTPTAKETTSPAENALKKENIFLKAQICAIKDGVKPDVVEDAVYLAFHEAETAGKADEEAVKKALGNVLKRHPEWAAKDGEKAGGFKVGAGQRDGENGKKKNAAPAGRIII